MALGALILGVSQVVLPKGTLTHRLFGYLWALLMIGVALSALFIHEIRIWGNYSPIHLLIPVTLFGLFSGIRAARRGRIKAHKRIMLTVFFLALVLTGAFTMLPGRVMYTVFFGPV